MFSFKKRKDIIKASIDETCVSECIVIFERLLMGDRYYYKNNTKVVKKSVAKYNMFEDPSDKIDVIDVKNGLHINVFLYENGGWKNYATNYRTISLSIGVFNNSHAVMLKNGVTS